MGKISREAQKFPAKEQFTQSQRRETQSSGKKDECRSHHYVPHFKLQTKN